MEVKIEILEERSAPGGMLGLIPIDIAPPTIAAV